MTTHPTSGPTTSSSWQSARVGDRVVYSFSVNRSPGRGMIHQPSAISGRVTLEVVAVQQPWVWLKLGFVEEGGKPMTNPRLAQDMLLPMRTDGTRQLELPREGVESKEQPTVAGRAWEARRYVRDNRAADGPLENRLYAVNPGPVYLTNALLTSSTTLSGFGDNGGAQLVLVEATQGAEGGTAAVPTLERPFGPGAWFDTRANMPGNTGTMRICFSAERGHVLRAQSPAPAAGGEPCPSFTEADVTPLEESVLLLLSEAVGMEAWPPPTTGATLRGSFNANGRTVPAVTFETAESEGTTRKVRYETYATNPWDAALSGLPLEARFHSLAEGVDVVDAKGKRTHEASTQLSGWGVWAGAAK